MKEWLVLMDIDRDFLTIAFRISIAATLSGLIGLEREIKNQPAGLRTHLLVGIGSCLMMLLSLYGFQSYYVGEDNVRFDPARIPSYVISGIGFLGAGTILVKGATIKGLTTAASIWIVAAIGLVVGAGMYGPAVLTTFIVIISLFVLNKIESRWIRQRSSQMLEIVVEEGTVFLGEFFQLADRYNINVTHFNAEPFQEKVKKYTRYRLELVGKDKNKMALLLEAVMKQVGIKRIFH